MRLVFLGTPAAAVPSLEALARSRHRIALVVSQPDRPSGRSGRAKAPPVAEAAASLGIPLFQPERVRNAAFVEELERAEPDVLVVVAYGRLLPPRVLDLARLGAINVHFSLLPAYRGAAPVQWALARGETVTGVTTMQMNERLDEGDVLQQRRVPIEEGEHAPALASRLAEAGAQLLLETLEGLERGSLKGIPQPAEGVSYAPPLKAEDGWIDPLWTAAEIEGRVRGFDPWPGAWVLAGGQRVRWVEARAVDQRAQKEPGTVLGSSDGELLIACGADSVLAVSRLQPEGRREMSGRDALNGRVLVPGGRVQGGPPR